MTSAELLISSTLMEDFRNLGGPPTALLHTGETHYLFGFSRMSRKIVRSVIP